ncbi:hypothetical protein CsSME_00045882 [Camellia sinensis var. sinensis]
MVRLSLFVIMVFEWSWNLVILLLTLCYPSLFSFPFFKEKHDILFYEPVFTCYSVGMKSSGKPQQDFGNLASTEFMKAISMGEEWNDGLIKRCRVGEDRARASIIGD